jgi:glycosyltransferase involved in cell wall biosynthesis
VATVDILVVSIDTTSGWRTSTMELVESLSRAGARVATAIAEPVPRVRTFALTDLVQAQAARRAGTRGIAAHKPKAVIYCSITASLQWPRPGAVWLDSIAAENRPGRHGIWQRWVERRRLEQAPLVLVMSERALAPLPGWDRRAILVPCPVERSAPPARDGARDIAAVTYAGDPKKRGLDRILAAWATARRDDETLLVTGTDRSDSPPGVRFTGRLAPAEYRALLRRSRVFVAAPRREDYGIAPLEALADGCLLVTAPAPGPYPALDLARQLDRRLVDDDLASAVRIALDQPAPDYAPRATALLAPFSRQAVDRTIAGRVLPTLLPGFESA